MFSLALYKKYCKKSFSSRFFKKGSRDFIFFKMCTVWIF